MANQQKLVLGLTEVEFTPLRGGYSSGRIKQISRWRSTSNKLYSYLFATNKWRDEVDVIIVAPSDAQQINTWTKDNTELTYYYDLVSNPSSTRTVHIVNKTDPMQMQHGWENRYEGVILLEEV